jgi:hypothetical protein
MLHINVINSVRTSYHITFQDENIEFSSLKLLKHFDVKTSVNIKVIICFNEGNTVLYTVHQGISKPLNR